MLRRRQVGLQITAAFPPGTYALNIVYKTSILVRHVCCEEQKVIIVFADVVHMHFYIRRNNVGSLGICQYFATVESLFQQILISHR